MMRRRRLVSPGVGVVFEGYRDAMIHIFVCEMGGSVRKETVRI